VIPDHYDPDFMAMNISAEARTAFHEIKPKPSLAVQRHPDLFQRASDALKPDLQGNPIPLTTAQT